MFLNMGNPTVKTDKPIIGTWTVQTSIERYLLLVVAICVPLMLFVKPVALSLMAPKHGIDHEEQNLMDKATTEVFGKPLQVRMAKEEK